MATAETVNISGWVESVPRFGYTRKCTAACTFAVGVSKPYGKAVYFDVAAGGCGAESCFNRLRKGMFVAVTGRIWQKTCMDGKGDCQNKAFLIADSIHQLDKHKGEIVAGLFYKGILPPDEGYYTTGGPFDKNSQVEFVNYDNLQGKGGVVGGNNK